MVQKPFFYDEDRFQNFAGILQNYQKMVGNN